MGRGGGGIARGAINSAVSGDAELEKGGEGQEQREREAG